MSKNIIRAAFVAAFAFVAGYCVYTSQQETEMSALALATVEALASGESATCTFSRVNKDQSTNTLDCSGNGSLCCTMN